MAAFQEANYQINVNSTRRVTQKSLDGELVGDFNIHHERGLLKPAVLFPVLEASMIGKAFRIEEVAAMEHDPLHELYSEAFFDPSIAAIDDDSDASSEHLRSVLDQVQLISDRHSLRYLLKCCSKPLPDAFYSKRKHFTLVATKIGGRLILREEGRSWGPEPGGYGRGFSDAMLSFDDCTDESVLALAGHMRYYRLLKTNLDGFGMLIRFETDAVSSDRETIELKSRKLPNPRYPLGVDFFLNMWGQMALSNTNRVVIGYHSRGTMAKFDDLSLAQIQNKSNLSDAHAQAIFARLVDILRWLDTQVANGEQKKLQYNCTTDKFKCTTLATPVPVVSEGTKTKLEAVSV